MKFPTLAERSVPGLSETLQFPREPNTCQGCGQTGDVAGFQRWLECDEWDKVLKPYVVLVLCIDCSNVYIEKHPRLYHRLELNAPQPGTMEICLECTHRDGLTCKNPIALHNGGAGMVVTIRRASQAHFYCGPRRGGGWLTTWPEPAKNCSGRNPPLPSLEICKAEIAAE